MIKYVGSAIALLIVGCLGTYFFQPTLLSAPYVFLSQYGLLNARNIQHMVPDNEDLFLYLFSKSITQETKDNLIQIADRLVPMADYTAFLQAQTKENIEKINGRPAVMFAIEKSNLTELKKLQDEFRKGKVTEFEIVVGLLSPGDLKVQSFTELNFLSAVPIFSLVKVDFEIPFRKIVVSPSLAKDYLISRMTKIASELSQEKEIIAKKVLNQVRSSEVSTEFISIVPTLKIVLKEYSNYTIYVTALDSKMVAISSSKDLLQQIILRSMAPQHSSHVGKLILNGSSHTFNISLSVAHLFKNLGMMSDMVKGFTGEIDQINAYSTFNNQFILGASGIFANEADAKKAYEKLKVFEKINREKIEWDWLRPQVVHSEKSVELSLKGSLEEIGKIVEAYYKESQEIAIKSWQISKVIQNILEKEKLTVRSFDLNQQLILDHQIFPRGFSSGRKEEKNLSINPPHSSVMNLNDQVPAYFIFSGMCTDPGVELRLYSFNQNIKSSSAEVREIPLEPLPAKGMIKNFVDLPVKRAEMRAYAIKDKLKAKDIELRIVSKELNFSRGTSGCKFDFDPFILSL